VTERRDPSLKQFTHKWMIYVVEPPQSKQEVSAFITCVRFHLHPSYKPHDVVDVTEAPFKLTRLGWGEFPIRIQLFFVDKRRNKTVDLIHHLKLDDTHSGKQLLGSERSIEIELDRNTDFKDTSSIPSTSNGNNTPQTPQEVTTAEPPASMAAKQRMSLLGGILKECVRRLPIVRAGKIKRPMRTRIQKHM
jgi:transcription initiation factor IIF auxiliary subunit